MSRWIKALAGGLLLTLLFQFCGFTASCEGIRQTVVRVHILAHSDGEADQALKLKVRDAVTKAGAHLLIGTETAAEARKKIETALPDLQEAAQQCVYEQGYTYPVTAALTNMYFTTRTYESGTLPAGYYDAVRITIGEGQGRNWWCVLYPPLCVGAATDLSETLSENQTDIVQNAPRYHVRFKVVEWWESFCNLFR